MSSTKGSAKLSVLDRAIIFAVEQHSGSLRKGTDIPYIVHPLEAIAIAASITSDLDVLAAAALHDVIEDTPAQLAEVEALFGKNVADLVAGESEDKLPGVPPAESWKLRKEATISSLQTATSHEKVLVLSDKLSNMRAISRDYTRLGDQLWTRFNQKDMALHAWYYMSVAEALSDLSEYAAYHELDRLIKDTFK